MSGLVKTWRKSGRWRVVITLAVRTIDIYDLHRAEAEGIYTEVMLQAYGPDAGLPHEFRTVDGRRYWLAPAHVLVAELEPEVKWTDQGGEDGAE